ncbi:hypothetical protein EAH_00065490 [Eimeria acervulina]|uniref:Uncharacterized protein n=1 Tax=Eimeria acervulina TaxID=5801 RepID=U6GPX2_EIMAC|nr:hypothetical protein EAH_00065490 [Eimeria acervulina]CDI82245.1 hypothetical protein EAH_00065490 [Eimeria acervulina]
MCGYRRAPERKTSLGKKVKDIVLKIIDRHQQKGDRKTTDDQDTQDPEENADAIGKALMAGMQEGEFNRPVGPRNTYVKGIGPSSWDKGTHKKRPWEELRPRFGNSLMDGVDEVVAKESLSTLGVSGPYEELLFPSAIKLKTRCFTDGRGALSKPLNRPPLCTCLECCKFTCLVHYYVADLSLMMCSSQMWRAVCVMWVRLLSCNWLLTGRRRCECSESHTTVLGVDVDCWSGATSKDSAHGLF